MKIVFAGSPEFSVPTLEKLATAHEILAVFTQPDRPAGRRQQLQSPPVKLAAQRLGLRVEQPERIRRDEPRKMLESLPMEMMVVVGYGQILPAWLLELPHYGCINLHASLLPAYRGAAPMQWAIANGDSRTGLTTMQMDPGMDTGPVLLRWETRIGPRESVVELAGRMSGPGAELVIETIRRLESGDLAAVPQDDSLATKAPILKKEDGQIDWEWTASRIFNRMRGFTPWPGIFTGFRGKRLSITGATPHPADGDRPTSRPGELLVEKNAVRVQCGEGTRLELLEVQPEGKRRMSAPDFLHGHHPESGERFQPG